MILLSPYSKPLRNGKPNPKNYPYWEEVMLGLDDEVIQVGLPGEVPIRCIAPLTLSLDDLKVFVGECVTWMSVDNFFPHFVNALCDKKPGVVVFSQSDPRIFGYPQNKNLLKSRDFLRKNQFEIWEEAVYDEKSFTDPQTIIRSVKELLK